MPKFDNPYIEALGAYQASPAGAGDHDPGDTKRPGNDRFLDLNRPPPGPPDLDELKKLNRENEGAFNDDMREELEVWMKELEKSGRDLIEEDNKGLQTLMDAMREMYSEWGALSKEGLDQYIQRFKAAKQKHNKRSPQEDWPEGYQGF